MSMKQRGKNIVIVTDGSDYTVYCHCTPVAKYDGEFKRVISKSHFYCDSQMTLKAANFLREELGLGRIKLMDWRLMA